MTCWCKGVCCTLSWFKEVTSLLPSPAKSRCDKCSFPLNWLARCSETHIFLLNIFRDIFRAVLHLELIRLVGIGEDTNSLPSAEYCRRGTRCSWPQGSLGSVYTNPASICLVPSLHGFLSLSLHPPPLSHSVDIHLSARSWERRRMGWEALFLLTRFSHNLA